jgi:predicted O-methyltransferase YrrM
MEDHCIYEYPATLDLIINDTQKMGFDMASEPKTGSLLRALAASKPNGKFLELGTGTGLSAAWILSGMDKKSTLTSVDNDPEAQSIALKYLGHDPRIKFVCEDGATWLEKNESQHYDFIFADAWPGKFSHLELLLNMLSIGGIYIIDDLLPQDNWPEGHTPRVLALMQEIESNPNLTSSRMAWASGLMLVTKTC